MCQLLETIKVTRNILHNIEYHNERVNRSRRQFFGKCDSWDLSTMIIVSHLNPDLVYRCRFLYGSDTGKAVFSPYVRRDIRKLYVIENETLDYSFKWADRRSFEILMQQIPDTDYSDMVIVKEGHITDTSFANLVFTDCNQWYTPSTPLLRGTKRQYYLDIGKIRERAIRLSDLHLYKSVRLINAMIDLEESDDIPVNNIIIGLPGKGMI